jgi:hypothetical protein
MLKVFAPSSLSRNPSGVGEKSVLRFSLLIHASPETGRHVFNLYSELYAPVCNLAEIVIVLIDMPDLSLNGAPIFQAEISDRTGNGRKGEQQTKCNESHASRC